MALLHHIPPPISLIDLFCILHDLFKYVLQELPQTIKMPYMRLEYCKAYNFQRLLAVKNGLTLHNIPTDLAFSLSNCVTELISNLLSTVIPKNFASFKKENLFEFKVLTKESILIVFLELGGIITTLDLEKFKGNLLVLAHRLKDLISYLNLFSNFSGDLSRINRHVSLPNNIG